MLYILNQDRDTTFKLSKSGPFKGKVYTKDIYNKGQYFGSNIYGKRFFKSILLGTYDRNEISKIVKKINLLLHNNAVAFLMPNPID